LIKAAALNAFDKATILANSFKLEISHVKFVTVKDYIIRKIDDFAYSFMLGNGRPLFLPKIVSGDSNTVMTVSVNLLGIC
jgi:hypothetical protein